MPAPHRVLAVELKPRPVLLAVDNAERQLAPPECARSLEPVQQLVQRVGEAVPRGAVLRLLGRHKEEPEVLDAAPRREEVLVRHRVDERDVVAQDPVHELCAGRVGGGGERDLALVVLHVHGQVRPCVGGDLEVRKHLGRADSREAQVREAHELLGRVEKGSPQRICCHGSCAREPRRVVQDERRRDLPVARSAPEQPRCDVGRVTAQVLDG